MKLHTKRSRISKVAGAWNQFKDCVLLLLLLNGFIGYVSQINPLQTKEWFFENHTVIENVEAKQIEKEVVEVLKGTFSAYNAEAAQTDSDPLTMASGKKVYEGAIANNCLAFGSKVVVNGKTYTVEDRMNKRYDCSHFDIFMNGNGEALKFGRKNIAYSIVK